MLADSDAFGSALANIGDLDGDGVADLAVGASSDAVGGYSTGAVHILFMNPNATVKSSANITSGTGGGPVLDTGSEFGHSLTNLGDLDGDGVPELAVGAHLDDTGVTDGGAVHILFLRSDGTAKSSTKIASGVGGAPTLVSSDKFGSSVTSVGDLDGDGVADLALVPSGTTRVGRVAERYTCCF